MTRASLHNTCTQAARAAWWLVLAVFLFRMLVPAGYMLDKNEQGRMLVTLCSPEGAVLKWLNPDGQLADFAEHPPSPDSATSSDCLFSLSVLKAALASERFLWFAFPVRPGAGAILPRRASDFPDSPYRTGPGSRAPPQ